MHKWFGDFHVLKNINLSVARGERIVICGPSGSGKSTLIRCINRLEEHDVGRIIVDGTELTTDVRNIQEIRKETGMVFQSFNLFPHLTILDLRYNQKLRPAAPGVPALLAALPSCEVRLTAERKGEGALAGRCEPARARDPTLLRSQLAPLST
ncbi:MAG: ATP-binding cassette domain-containing protein, partial [Gammaproteobacteria bacterium]